MPLHLLGKKSWNVYNSDNIERVRRDEAGAKAKEEEDERRMQEEDAGWRLDQLRGLEPKRSAFATAVETKAQEEPSRFVRGEPRKRRRLAGEDDTDRDIRLASEAVLSRPQALTTQPERKPSNDVSLTDETGHFTLFDRKSLAKSSSKNPEAEAEAVRERRNLESQYTLRFSNAEGYKSSKKAPWYSSAGHARSSHDDSKALVGDTSDQEDHRKLERANIRRAEQDPLASMMKGVRELREVQKEREKWNAERKKELENFEPILRGKNERNHRRYEGELDNFSLDSTSRGTPSARHGHRQPHGPRSQEEERDHGRHRHRHNNRQRTFHRHDKDDRFVSSRESSRYRDKAPRRQSKEGRQGHRSKGLSPTHRE